MPERNPTAALIRTIKLDTARDAAPLHYSGGFIAVRAGTTAQSSITVHFDDPHAEGITLKRGQGFKHFAFSKLYITNTAQAGESVELVIAGNKRAVREALFDVLLTQPAQDVNINGQDAPLTTDPIDRDPRLLGRVKTLDSAGAVIDTTSGVQQRTVAAVAADRFAHADWRNTSGTTVLATVPVGKKYIIERAFASTSIADNAASLQIKNGATVVAKLMPVAGGLQHWGFEGMVVPAGYTIELNMTGTHTVSASLTGRIEAA